MPASAGSIVRELIPALAASLGQVRRVPDKGNAWAGSILKALEAEGDARHERLRRRAGFARRLAELAGLGPDEQANTLLAIFFHELLPSDIGKGPKTSRPWRDFLLRNEDWLHPSLELCEAVRDRKLADLASHPGVVAKIAIDFDEKTLERHERPLQVVEAIVAAGEGTDAQRIVDLLWSEDGQALCDHHFRRHPHAYRLAPEDLRRALAQVYRSTPRETPDVDVQGVRFSHLGERAATANEVQPAARAQRNASQTLGNFDKRRQALRSRTEQPGRSREDERGPDGAQRDTTPRPESTHTQEEPMTTDNSRQEALEMIERLKEQRAAGELQDTPTEEKQPEPIARVQTSANSRHEALDLIERLKELRIQLGQIQRTAAEAEQLLAGIAPKIDQFAAWMADVDAVVERWRHREAA